VKDKEGVEKNETEHCDRHREHPLADVFCRPFRATRGRQTPFVKFCGSGTNSGKKIVAVLDRMAKSHETYLTVHKKLIRGGSRGQPDHLFLLKTGRARSYILTEDGARSSYVDESLGKFSDWCRCYRALHLIW